MADSPSSSNNFFPFSLRDENIQWTDSNKYLIVLYLYDILNFSSYLAVIIWLRFYAVRSIESYNISLEKIVLFAVSCVRSGSFISNLHNSTSINAFALLPETLEYHIHAYE